MKLTKPPKNTLPINKIAKLNQYIKEIPIAPVQKRESLKVKPATPLKPNLTIPRIGSFSQVESFKTDQNSLPISHQPSKIVSIRNSSTLNNKNPIVKNQIVSERVPVTPVKVGLPQKPQQTKLNSGLKKNESSVNISNINKPKTSEVHNSFNEAQNSNIEIQTKISLDSIPERSPHENSFVAPFKQDSSFNLKDLSHNVFYNLLDRKRKIDSLTPTSEERQTHNTQKSLTIQKQKINISDFASVHEERRTSGIMVNDLVVNFEKLSIQMRNSGNKPRRESEKDQRKNAIKNLQNTVEKLKTKAMGKGILMLLSFVNRFCRLLKRIGLKKLLAISRN